MKNFLCKVFLSLLFSMTAIVVSSQQQAFFEGFESGDLTTNGWTQDGIATTTFWSVDSVGVGTVKPFEGRRMAKLFSATYQQPVKLITPVINNFTSYRDPFLSFYVASQRFNAGIRDTLKVYYRIPGGDNKWTPIRAYHQGINGWQKIRLQLRQYITTDPESIQIAFEYCYANGKGIALDSIRIFTERTCFAPVKFSTMDVKNTSAIISWIGSEYTQQYSLKISSVPIATPNLDHTTANVFDGNTTNGLSVFYTSPAGISLTPNTVYYCYVKADCGNGDVSNWSTMTFRTRCNPTPADSVSAKVEDFENYPVNYFPHCWLRLRDVTGDWEGKVLMANEYLPVIAAGGAHSGSKSLKLSGYYENNASFASPRYVAVYAISKGYDVPSIKAYQVNFWAKSEKAGSILRVGVMTNPDDMNTFEEIKAITIQSENVWQKQVVYLINNVNNGKYIAFKVDPHDGNTPNTFYIDDYVLEKIPNCVPPTNGKLVNITSQGSVLTAYFSWEALFPTNAFNIHLYHTPTSDPGHMAPQKSTINVQGTSGSVTNLASHQKYYAYIQNACNSTWIGPIEFTTPQAPENLPYTDGFEDNSEPKRWIMINGSQTNKWVKGNKEKRSGSRSLYISNNNSDYKYNPANTSTVYASKNFNLVANKRVEVTFLWKGKGSVNDAFVSVYLVHQGNPKQPTAGVAPDDSWIKLSDEPLAGNEMWTRFVAGAEIKTTGIYSLVLCWQNKSSAIDNNPPIAIDDLDVREMTCSTVEDLKIKDVTEDKATVTWKAGPVGGATQWYLWVLPASAPDTTGKPPIVVNNATTYQITGLNANNEYILYIVSNCKAVRNTSYALTKKFQTRQILSNLPFEDSFEGTITWHFENGDQRNKWIVGTNDKYDGTKSMYISNNNSKREYTNSSTPNPTSYVYAYKTFEFDKNEVYGLKFKYKSFGEDKKDVMNVFVVSDEIHEGVIEAGNPNGMTEDNNTPPQQWIRVVNDKLNNRDYIFDNQSTNNWKDFVGTFAVKKSGRYKVIFFWKNNNTSGTITGAAAVDSVSIKMVDCAAPFDIDVDLNGTTAIVKWAKGANATSWEVSWGTNKGSLSTPVTVTTPEFHATGINVASEQPYYFKIKTKCSPGEDTKIYSYLPVTPFPFTTSFEVSADNTNWKIGSKTSPTNKWIIGADPQAVARGEYALYVTDNPATKKYHYTINTSSESYAYRSFRLVEGNKYRLSFKWKGKGDKSSYGNYYYDYMRVYLVPQKYKGGLADASVSPSTDWIDLNGSRYLAGTDTWQLRDTTFISPNSGIYYLAFRWVNNSYYGEQPPAAVDEIEFYDIRDCSMVSGIWVKNIAKNGAYIYWRSTKGAKNYDVKVSTTPINPEYQAATTINDTNIVDTFLNAAGSFTPGTTYYVYVRANCGGDNHSLFNVVPIVFATTCDPIDLPYSNNFDILPSGILPPCWTSLVSVEEADNAGKYDPIITNVPGALTTNKYISMSTYYEEDKENTKVFAFLPGFNKSVDKLQVKFRLIGDATKKVMLMVSRSNSDPSIAAPLASFFASPQGRDYTLALTGIPASGKYIAFMAQGDINGTGTVGVDSVKVTEADMCMSPDSLLHSGVTTDKVDIRWKSPYVVDQTWNLVVTTKDISSNMSQLATLSPSEIAYNQNVKGNKKTVNNLQPGTTYYYYIRKVCDNNTFSAWFPYDKHTFKTDCSLSQKCQFKVVKKSSKGVSWGTSSKLYIKQGEKIIEKITYASNIPNSFTDTTRVSLCPDDYEFSFSKKSNTKDISFEVYKDGVIIFSSTANKDTLEEHKFSLLSSCQILMCKVVEDVKFNNSHSSVNATWTGSATSYDVKIYKGIINKPQLSDTVLQTQTVTSNSVVFGALAPNTDYTIFIKSNCQSGGITVDSKWERAETRTLLNIPAENIPPAIVSNFEDSPDTINWRVFSSHQTANKWVRGTATNNGAGTKSLYISNDLASYNYNLHITSYSYATRYVNLTGGKDYHLAFDWKCEGQANYDVLNVFLIPAKDTRISIGNPYGMQDGNNVAPEDWISCTGPLSGNNTWKNLDTIISVGNTGKYFLAFFWKNNSSAGTQPPAAIDNVNFFEEVCPQVQNMATSNITTTSATISWTGMADSYDVKVYLNSNAIDPNTSTPLMQSAGQAGLSYNMTGLTPNRRYAVYVRSTCVVGGITHRSMWRKHVFSTDFVTGSLPINTGFENATDNLEWVTTSSNGTENSWAFGTATAHSGSKSMYVSKDEGATNTYMGNQASYIYAFRPFTFKEVSEYKIKYNWKGKGQTNYDLGRVCLVPENYKSSLMEGSDNGMANFKNILPSGWIDLGKNDSLDNLLSGMTTWDTVSRNFVVPADGVYYLTFFWKNNAYSTENPPVAIDNVSLDSVPCSRPRKLTYNTSPTTAKFKWKGNALKYHVILKDLTDPANPIIVDQRDVTGDTMVYTGLTPVNKYVFTINSVCNAAGTIKSDETTISFLAINSVDSLPINATFEDIADNKLWKFVNSKGANKWKIGSAEKQNGSNGMYISNTATGTANIYATDSTSWSYAYRKVTLYKDEAYAYSFSWKSKGENNWDYMRAFVIPTSDDISKTSIAGDKVSSIKMIKNTPTDWIDLNTKPDSALCNKTEWNTIDSSGLRVTQDGDYYLTFLWKNDGSRGDQPPAAVDNFVFSTVQTEEFSDTVCQGAEYSEHHFNLTSEDVQNIGHNIFRTVYKNPTTGQISNIKLNLYIMPGASSSVNRSVCQGDTIHFYGSPIYTSRLIADSVYDYHYYTVASNYCDSTITMKLLVYPKYNKLVDTTVNNCDLPLTINGKLFYRNYPKGTWEARREGKTIHNCDSNVVYIVHIDGPCTDLSMVAGKNIVLVPNPINAGEKLTIRGEFTDEEFAGLKVEVITSAGEVVNEARPTQMPAEIGGFEARGVYIVRITTGRGEIIHGKVVVK